MAKKYKVSGLDAAVSDITGRYSAAAVRNIKKAVDDVTDEMADTVRRNVRFQERTGNYVKNFKTRTVHEDAVSKRNRWYVDNGEHRLTHLLENGHRVVDRNGRVHGRTRAYPHIKHGAAYAREALPERIRKAAEEAGNAV